MENTEENKEQSTESKEYVLSDNQQLFLAAMIATNFDINESASRTNLTRRAYYHWLKNTPDFVSAIDEAFEQLKDKWEAEGNFAIEGQYTIHKDADGKPNELDQNGRPIRHYINPPDRGFLKFKHLTKMKDRGYVYRQELAGIDGKDLFDGFEIDLTKPTTK